MSFAVHELPRAKSDKRHIFEWLYERSPQGAGAWLDAYDAMIERLKTRAASFGEALENADCPHAEVKQAFFKTRRGRVSLVEGSEAYVLRVRGPGQAPVDVDDLSRP